MDNNKTNSNTNNIGNNDYNDKKWWVEELVTIKLVTVIIMTYWQNSMEKNKLNLVQVNTYRNIFY